MGANGGEILIDCVKNKGASRKRVKKALLYSTSDALYGGILKAVITSTPRCAAVQFSDGSPAGDTNFLGINADGRLS